MQLHIVNHIKKLVHLKKVRNTTFHSKHGINKTILRHLKRCGKRDSLFFYNFYHHSQNTVFKTCLILCHLLLLAPHTVVNGMLWLTKLELISRTRKSNSKVSTKHSTHPPVSFITGILSQQGVPSFIFIVPLSLML